MNAKEEILKKLKNELDGFKKIHNNYIEGSIGWTTVKNVITKLQSLIKATENAIFEVPSEEEIREQIEPEDTKEWKQGYKYGIHFILNYKKPETDDRTTD